MEHARATILDQLARDDVAPPRIGDIDLRICVDVLDEAISVETVYTVKQVEAIIRRTWEVALRAGLQQARQSHMRGYSIDRFVEQVLGHRIEET